MHYWGLDAIAKRLDVKPGSILRMYETQGLPLLKRRHGMHPRLIWYSCEPLLTAWQLAQAKHQHQAHMEKKRGLSRQTQETR